MKQVFCLLLALVMLLGLLTSCAQANPEAPLAPSIPEVTTLPAEKGPPQTPEEFLDQLNDTLKSQSIPMEFSFLEPEDYGSGYFLVEADAVYTGPDQDVYSQALELWMIYYESLSGPLEEIQFYIAPDSDPTVQDLYRQLSVSASALCDKQMTAEKVDALLTAAGEPAWKLAYADGIGYYNDTYNEDTHLLYQPKDLTYFVTTHTVSKEQWYRIAWTDAEDTVFGMPKEEIYLDNNAVYVSVRDFEQRLNENLANLGVPVACTLHPYCDYGRWTGVFRFTTLDDPDYSYPPVDVESYDTPEDLAAAFDNYFVTIDLDIDAMDPISKDAPIRFIDLTTCDYASWGDDYPVFSQALSQDLMEAILQICGTDNPEADLEALYAAEPIDDGYFMDNVPYRALSKGQYSLEFSDDNDGRKLYRIQFPILSASWMDTDGLSGEELLDPALLTYDLQVEGPMVLEGSFNYYQPYSSYFSGIKNNWRVLLDSAINDYLMYTRSEVSIHSHIADDSSEIFKIYAGYNNPEDALLDYDNYGLMVNGDYEVFVYYNTNVEAYYTTPYLEQLAPEKENVLRIPIAVSLLLDDRMTEEEAVRLHTHQIPCDYVTEEGIQVTVYNASSPDVVHILLEDPETGLNNYFCVTRSWFDFAYSAQAEYLDN